MEKYVICECGRYAFVQAYGDPVDFNVFATVTDPAKATIYNREQAYRVARRLGSTYYQPMRAY